MYTNCPVCVHVRARGDRRRGSPRPTPKTSHRPGVQSQREAGTCVTAGHSREARRRQNPESVRLAQGRVQKLA
jgi:hypothetical protein